MTIEEQTSLRQIMRKVDEAVQDTRATAGEETDYAPLTERAPVKMPEIVRMQYDIAAKSLEEAATALEQEMQSTVQLMRDEAQSLRNLGESQALAIEASSLVIRDAHRVFKSEFDKLANFRMGLRAEPGKIENFVTAVGVGTAGHTGYSRR